MLFQLLNTPKHPQKQLYSFLPVSTSLQQQLQKQANQIFAKIHNPTKKKRASDQFISNDDPENIKDDLIMLKLKGYVDRADFRSKNVEIKKLPSKVQVGKVIDGDLYNASKNKKIRRINKDKSLTQYILDLDKKQSFSSRKFTQIQRSKQRKKKITKKSMLRKNKNKNNK